ncbi:MAG: D-glycero-beta-D-manno-heptose 1-phosphate adenylyltransferase [Salinivirgaceae bacterium]|jgi:rfaE bifunctional protein nucleotidyltransferase chain/domain|nr:D-glycero-beta-D-manno-heptose 1-phosphate adenylyltransferase [Salinivirgaceae bacterium]
MKQQEILDNKIHTKESIAALLSIWNFKEQKIVFSNGCFDILHRGHIEYLAKAADLGHKLVIGLNTDASVRKIKGPQRPLQDEQSRSILLAALHFVDAVILFDEPTPYELIKAIQPDFLVKGNDYKAEDVVGYDIVTQKGGQVVTIELTPGYSSTNIINKAIGQ